MMVEEPTLSVVLPNFNHGYCLAEAVLALAGQERAPDEIVIVDDGSTDNSRDVVTRLRATVGKVRLIEHGQNRGVAAALRTGLAATTGRYVYFAAADDLVMPGFFSLALQRLEAYPTLGLFCAEALLLDTARARPVGLRPAVRPREHGGPVDPNAVGALLRACDNWILTGSAVFRREAVEAAGGFNDRLGSFTDGFMARKVALDHGFYFEPQIVATWRVSPGSVSRRTAQDPVAALDALARLPRSLETDPAFPSWYPEVFGRRWRFATSRIALTTSPVDLGLVAMMAAPSRLERLVWTLATPWAARRAFRLLALSWLWLRLRPTTAIGLLRMGRTAIRRRAEVRSLHRPEEHQAQFDATIPR